MQARSRATVDAILEAAARVFRREGWKATTNRIAREAGVGIGSLYEYFPDKQALLTALATRHVEVAEAGIRRALASERLAELLPALQAAVLESQRFPSHALTLVNAGADEGARLRARVDALRARVLARLADEARCAELDQPEVRARVCFEVLADLSARAMFTDPDQLESLSRHYLRMAANHLGVSLG